MHGGRRQGRADAADAERKVVEMDDAQERGRDSAKAEQSAREQTIDAVLSQLRGLVKSAVTEIRRSKDLPVEPKGLGGTDLVRPVGYDFKLDEHLQQIERRYIEAALWQTKGHILQASRLLGVTYRHLRYRITRLDVKTGRRGSARPSGDLDQIPTVLLWLLDYELSGAARQRSSVSFLMVDGANGRTDLKEFFTSKIRRSDALFQLDGRAGIVLGKTGYDGAVTAAGRFRRLYTDDGDLRFGLACYPRDAHAPRELVAVAHRRVRQAGRMETGSLVAEG